MLLRNMHSYKPTPPSRLLHPIADRPTASVTHILAITQKLKMTTKTSQMHPLHFLLKFNPNLPSNQLYTQCHNSSYTPNLSSRGLPIPHLFPGLGKSSPDTSDRFIERSKIALSISLCSSGIYSIIAIHSAAITLRSSSS